MMGVDDPRLMEAKALPVQAVVDKIGISGLSARSGELIGPCPLCAGRDRFGINLRSHAFQCRKCDLRGGDMIALAQGVLGLGFKDALSYLCGDLPASIDPKELERRRAYAKRQAERAEAKQNMWRKQAVDEARSIWARALPGSRGVVAAYLRSRGIVMPSIPDSLRFLVDHQYGKGKVPYSGPCMIAGIFDRSGELQAVHQTWVDRKPPHGKALIEHDGETFPAKLVKGAKKGNVIPLITPPHADTLVMGEGIETTLSAYVAEVPGLNGAAFWAGVDLGNMSGRMKREPGKRHSGVPDLEDGRAFVPPPWVRRLVFIQDGDSDPAATRAKLTSGLQRAMHFNRGLVAQIVPAPKGCDLNDVLRGNGHD